MFVLLNWLICISAVCMELNQLRNILSLPKGKGMHLEHLITYKINGMPKSSYTKKKYKNGQLLRIWIGADRIYTTKEVYASVYSILLMVTISTIITFIF